ncbi:hypothetical protein [Glaciimonas immobilis]|uniref:TolB-like protein n=1 Tax=Glaciimonas immobilis TaxID=728004 RepID=A0A840S081_9BURK|nr:hypothetical protein [Glaciimonas immobilis]KAF3998445.1 hypothetical protein HAV38_08340 [Glaciimonas immobilis]MBB5202060.1 TolB-like protein [Glaciimonas immobilis]
MSLMFLPKAIDTKFLPVSVEPISYNATTFLPKDVHLALSLVLASQEFHKAKRTSRLLRFLVEKSLTGEVRETSEYAIGIGVFDRDPATYSTDHDPIVRVQIGRLREKLKAYYAVKGAHTDISFDIPLGSYMPLIHKTVVPDIVGPPESLLTVVPLLSVSSDTQGAVFTSGLTEELTFQLFKMFGTKIVPPLFYGVSDLASPKKRHLLEGSIRVEGVFVRAALRLIDVEKSSIAWAEQFDHKGPLLISAQQELASKMCMALKLHFLSITATC